MFLFLFDTISFSRYYLSLRFPPADVYYIDIRQIAKSFKSLIVLGINFQLVSRAMLCLHKYHTVRETAGCQHTRTAAYVYRKNNIQIKKCWDQRHRLFLLHLLKAYFYVFLFDKRTMSYGHWCIEVRHWWLLSKTLFLVRRLQVSRREIFFLFSLARIILLISSAIGSLLLWHYISAHASKFFDSILSTEEL